MARIWRLSVQSQSHGNFVRTLVFLSMQAPWLVSKIHPTFSSNETSRTKPIETCLHLFSRAWHRLRVFATSSNWLIPLFASVVCCGQSSSFCFGLTLLINRKFSRQLIHSLLIFFYTSLVVPVGEFEKHFLWWSFSLLDFHR